VFLFNITFNFVPMDYDSDEELLGLRRREPERHRHSPAPSVVKSRAATAIRSEAQPSRLMELLTDVEAEAGDRNQRPQIAALFDDDGEDFDDYQAPSVFEDEGKSYLHIISIYIT
jgi:hypothetical protein